MPFKLRSNPDLNFCEDSSVEAHLRRFLVGWLKDFPITLEESAELALILVEIPTEKYFILEFFPAIEIVLEFQKYYLDLLCVILFHLFVCSSCFHYFIAHHQKHILETHLELA